MAGKSLKTGKKAHKKPQKKGRSPSGKSKETKVKKLLSFLKKGKKTKGKR